jgi:hypothetical protein
VKVEVDPGEADEEISRVAALTGQLGRAAKLLEALRCARPWVTLSAWLGARAYWKACRSGPHALSSTTSPAPAAASFSRRFSALTSRARRAREVKAVG